jgi:hypothetical protein
MRGGSREGSGRKTKAEELGLPKLIEEVIGLAGKKELIRKIYAQATEGKEGSQKLLMEYIFGKPSEHIRLDGELSQVVTWLKPNEGANDTITS